MVGGYAGVVEDEADVEGDDGRAKDLGEDLEADGYEEAVEVRGCGWLT